MRCRGSARGDGVRGQGLEAASARTGAASASKECCPGENQCGSGKKASRSLRRGRGEIGLTSFSLTMGNGTPLRMSTRALVGHYTDDGSWRAVWVHVDGAPEDLGAHLARAVVLHGGDPRPVLAHVFSTKGWWSWPDDPHHPADPDDVIFTPENVIDDVHWFYLCAVPERRLDVVPAGRTSDPSGRFASAIAESRTRPWVRPALPWPT